MTNNDIIALLDSCKDAIVKKDIITLVDTAERLGLSLSANFASPIINLISNLIIDDIKNFMIQNHEVKIKIIRKNIYHEETFDCYCLREGELLRNGVKAKFTSVGKLYAAYKKIHNISL